MFLDLSKALSFFMMIMSLYRLAIGAFFVPGSNWDERLSTTLVRVAVAAAVSLLSALLFSLPLKADSDVLRLLMSTLPARLFFWGLGTIAILFICSWYFDSYPCSIAGARNCIF
jgi:hypothetical protein